MEKEYNFDLDTLDASPIDIRLDNEQQRVMQYLNDVARHVGIDPYELHLQILKEWAYGRAIKEAS